MSVAAVLIGLVGSSGVAGVGINVVEIARGIVGVVHGLGDGAAVGGDAEEGLAMFVSAWFGEGGGELYVWESWDLCVGFVCA